MKLNMMITMESFQQTIRDLYGLHFSGDVYNLLMKFVTTSTYVDQILAYLLLNKHIKPYQLYELKDIIIPKTYFECDWDALFRHDFLSQKSDCMIYYIPNEIYITHKLLNSGIIISFAIKNRRHIDCHMNIIDLAVNCVAIGYTIEYGNNLDKLNICWPFVVK